MKKFTQCGRISIIILSPLFIFSLIGLFRNSQDLHSTAFFGTLAIILLITFLLFYKLTIIVDDQSISFKMGIGVIRGRYLIQNILSCKTVNNSFLNGFGVRKISRGWLFNVSGLKSIELSFKNKNSIIRLGTDKPEEICKIISGLIENTTIDDTTSFPKTFKFWSRHSIGALIAITILSLQTITGNKPVSITFKANDFTIGGMDGQTIPYNQILSVDTTSIISDKITKVHGFETWAAKKGTFTLDGIGRARLFIKTKVKLYVFIKMKDGEPYFINTSDRSSTINFYKELKNRSTEVLH